MLLNLGRKNSNFWFCVVFSLSRKDDSSFKCIKDLVTLNENELVSLWLMETVDFRLSLKGWVVQTDMEKAIPKTSL